MTPILLNHDEIDSLMVDAIALTQLRSSNAFSSEASYFQDLIGRELRRILSFAAMIALRTTTLLDHVLGIILFCSKKEMSRIHASSIIAYMTDTLAIRNLAVMKYPRKAVSINIVTSSASDVESSVSRGLVSASAPHPASVCLFNLSPESHFSGFRLPHVEAFIGKTWAFQ